MESIKYIVESKRDQQWGLSICSAGFEEIAPKASYPSSKHGPGYYFSPQKGRVLEEYQLIYIPEGKGTLETASAGRMNIESGCMFLLFPNEWHTYQPDQEKGWKQYWIGFRGIHIDHRVTHEFLRKEAPLFHVGCNEEIVYLYQKAINTALYEKVYFQQLLAGITNYLLGLMYSLDKNHSFNKDHKMTELINHARILMREKVESSISAQEIADQLHVGYSVFRKKFKEYTGFSPAQYFLELKLQRAKELLNTTHMPIKEIAYLLHFASSEYFSAFFRKRMGINPGHFRTQ